MIHKIEKRILRREGLKTITVIGDPGCEGLGTVMVQVFAAALQAAKDDDMIFIAGDLVPEGTKLHYDRATEIIRSIAGDEPDIFCIKGNHDTGDYEEYFGASDYAVLSGSFALIALDNAARKFTEAGMTLVSEVLADPAIREAVIAFHIPVPNHFTGNAVSEAEHERLRQAYAAHKEKVRCFLCGHVHSRFEDVVDGIPFVCTGGGGAGIEDVSADIRACDVDNHIVKFTVDPLSWRVVDLSPIPYSRDRSEAVIKENLSKTISGELYAHLQYLAYAERAQRRGYGKTANLFRALAESEYRHAKAFFTIESEKTAFSRTAEKFIPVETFEYQVYYKQMAEFAESQSFPLTELAYRQAMAAEQEHAKVLERFVKDADSAEDVYYVCPVCGFFGTKTAMGARCPVCGAPARDYLQFAAE